MIISTRFIPGGKSDSSEIPIYSWKKILVKFKTGNAVQNITVDFY